MGQQHFITKVTAGTKHPKVFRAKPSANTSISSCFCYCYQTGAVPAAVSVWAQPFVTKVAGTTIH